VYHSLHIILETREIIQVRIFTGGWRESMLHTPYLTPLETGIKIFHKSNSSR